MRIIDYDPAHLHDLMDGDLNDGAVKNRPFIRFAKTDIMQRVTTENKLWRVQGVCKADWPAARRFARLMGFEEEGLMRKYGPEQADYMRIAKVT